MKKTGLVVGGLTMAIGLHLCSPLMAQDIDFGDDESRWAQDGQCDDPRFAGEGAALFLSPLDRMHDASDCQAAFEAGAIALADEANDDSTISSGGAAGEIDFGDDSGDWAHDGECDDPRFAGIGVGVALDDHLMADSSDCSAAYQNGTVELADESELAANLSDIDFGDDTGEWALDGECDDPRFGGTLGNHIFSDASDCRSAFETGAVSLVNDIEPPAYPVVVDGIDFGDDSGSFSWDNECDDPRFDGVGVGVPLEDHLMADASDCAAAYQAGVVVLDEGNTKLRIED